MRPARNGWDVTAPVLDLLYAAGLVASAPLWLYRMIRHGRYREDIAQRFGAVPRRYGLQPVIWVHGVSLGEINAARTLVSELHAQLPDYRVVISTTTETGMARARRLFRPDHVVFRWPLDFSFAVHRALDRIRPSLVVMMEGEIWPNFLSACNRRGIATAVVNGRIGADKGYPRYKALGTLASSLYNRLDAIGVQTTEYARLYESLGVDADRLHVTGMMKFDTAPAGTTVDGADALAAAMGLSPDSPLLVAGGTGPGEEQQVLAAFETVRQAHPAVRLAIVPRKPERFDEVARLVESAGRKIVRRSQRPDGTTTDAPDGAVILGDTMGELRKFYALATGVFVGRSLVPMGGSDMIESAALGQPTCFGPHTYNFPQADDLAAHGCARVADADALAACWSTWLSDANAAHAAGQAARDYVQSQRGATQRNVAMLCGLLGRRPAAAPGTIATDLLEEPA